MLPPVYGPPAAIVLILGGALACFAGYRLFRIVLGIYGFILGAMLASSIMGVGNTIGMLVAAAIGGVVGSIVLVMAYFVGIALVGAGLGALIGHVIWTWVRPANRQRLRSAWSRSSAPSARWPATLRHHRRHGVRRRVDDHRRRGEPVGDARHYARRFGNRSLDSVSDESTPGRALGADRLDRAGTGRRQRPARDHGDGSEFE